MHTKNKKTKQKNKKNKKKQKQCGPFSLPSLLERERKDWGGGNL
jgi:hypothetical protein